MSALAIDKGFVIDNLTLSHNDNNDITIFDSESEITEYVIVPIEAVDSFILCLLEFISINDEIDTLPEPIPFYKVSGEESSVYITGLCSKNLRIGSSRFNYSAEIRATNLNSVIFTIKKLKQHCLERMKND